MTLTSDPLHSKLKALFYTCSRIKPYNIKAVRWIVQTLGAAIDGQDQNNARKRLQQKLLIVEFNESNWYRGVSIKQIFITCICSTMPLSLHVYGFWDKNRTEQWGQTFHTFQKLQPLNSFYFTQLWFRRKMTSLFRNVLQPKLWSHFQDVVNIIVSDDIKPSISCPLYPVTLTTDNSRNYATVTVRATGVEAQDYKGTSLPVYDL